MKAKFVKVWDNRRFGYIPFIVLQVEETDTFLTKANFNPGYKFVIQALYSHVGAAGGHKFNPFYYKESVQDRSQKIETNEADALGFYLGNIDNIHNIPDNLYTEKFWDAVWTSQELKDEEYEGDEDYYKLLLTTGISSMAMSISELDGVLANLQTMESPIFKNTSEIVEALTAANNSMRERYKQMGWDIDEKSQVVKCLVVDKNDLSVINAWCATGNNITIADYLWLPFDEMPLDVFHEFNKVNEDYSGLQILDLSMYL
ncbi:conserved hypothetical protein [Candidatus Desulfosporosinus infrequens]|uniref:Uncharacterized protein n=1 Tax=Candidatus Desulfosporosinus infrequens TaxID=2043169 RepID=A0A2U3L449_9FIRM|nr:conserved hypothetical protein [Candidatus Desulfosporosinus infrequens]